MRKFQSESFDSRNFQIVSASSRPVWPVPLTSLIVSTWSLGCGYAITKSISSMVPADCRSGEVCLKEPELFLLKKVSIFFPPICHDQQCWSSNVVSKWISSYLYHTEYHAISVYTTILSSLLLPGTLMWILLLLKSKLGHSRCIERADDPESRPLKLLSLGFVLLFLGFGLG